MQDLVPFAREVSRRCGSQNEFVSSCASLIRNHFAHYTFGLEVRSNSRYLAYGSSAWPFFSVCLHQISQHPHLQNLAVLGGNDPHSYGVTSHRASMNTLRPKSLYENTLGCLTKITVLNLPYHAVHGLVCQTHYKPILPARLYSIHLAASFPSFM